MKKGLTLFFILFLVVSHAQQEASNWYFGNQAGINFDIDTGAVTPLTNSALTTIEGCTSISDATGNLILYTDGQTVYNANHAVMLNGTDLLGDESSTQSAIIVPKPDDSNIYYIFTVGSGINPTGLNYSTVDLSLDGGLGGVITSSKNTSLLTACSEKISAVLKDCETGNIWVIALSDSSGNSTDNMNTFFAYEVTNNGISSNVITSTVISTTNVRGALKFSPNGDKLACASPKSNSNSLFIADFDKVNGIVSNPEVITISTSPNNHPYGIEFSPNGELLYVTASNDYFNQQNPELNEVASNHQSVLLQYDLTALDISNSQIIIDQRQLYRSSLQLGPNGKIYRSLSSTYQVGIPFLSVINNPNGLDANCDYEHATIDLGGNLSRQGLPPFITSYFSQKIDIIQNGISILNLDLCIDDTYTLIADDVPNATYTWTKDGVLLTESDFDLDIDAPGNYEVLIEFTDGDCYTKEGQAIVTYFEYPIANMPNNILVCDDNNDGIETFDFNSQNNAILLGQDATQFAVRYYNSQADADARENEIIGSYNNQSPTETIYVRVENNGHVDCYNTTSFDISVFKTPTIGDFDNFDACDEDNNTTDGLTAIELLDFNNSILDGQNSDLNTISYHNSQNDADTGNNSLPDTYTNQTPFSEIIYIRIENNSNRTCYRTKEITITIIPAPEATDTTLIQCDEDENQDGLTIFNLTEITEDITDSENTIQFFLSLVDAENNENEIDNITAFSNTTNPQDLSVKVTNPTSNCSNYVTLSLEISTTTLNNYFVPAVCDELNSEDGINTFNLNEIASIFLETLPANSSLVNFYATYNDALLEQNELSSPYNNTTPYSETLYVRADNNNACYGISKIFLTVNPLPPVDEDETILYCLNNYPEKITLSIDSSLIDVNTYDYNWSNGETTPTIAINEVGTYTITATNKITQCSKTKTITVEASNIATIETIEISDGTINNNNNEIAIISIGEGNYQYALVDQDGFTTPFQDSFVFSNLAPGFYTVLVKDIKNDCGTVDKVISVIGFPLYFTPNGDGTKDTWQVYGVSSLFQPNSLIYIFNRYGKLITKLSSKSKGWDGTYNGKNLPTDDYWFSVTLQDGRIFKSHFTLKR